MNRSRVLFVSRSPENNKSTHVINGHDFATFDMKFRLVEKITKKWKRLSLLAVYIVYIYEFRITVP